MKEQLTVIGAIPYQFCSEFCKLVKNADDSAIKTASRILAKSIPEKCVLIPVPSHFGQATYTRALARLIAFNACLWLNKNAIYADSLFCNYHESLCELKQKGANIDNVEVNVAVKHAFGDILRHYVEEGRDIVVVDNVVDTGKTASSCIVAIREVVDDNVPVKILCLGDTGIHRQ